mmetsp:Transcript_15433/g.23523  ORF Transcript_15433/g.23523 Transcript_15433/m.23523 type:complete len:124 (-) Transcript_15433:464-835(-)
MTRCANCFKPTSCVTKMSVMRCSRFNRSNKSMIMFPFLVSRSPVGSSNSNTSGLLAMARLMVTRCCSPPDSCDGRCPARSLRPTCVNNCIARSRICADDRVPCNIIGNSTFSSAVMDEMRLNV